MNWDVVYEKAIRDDNSLFFPQKLTHEFLQSAKRTLGSYIYSNQYLNEVIPTDLQAFKKDWFKYYTTLPEKLNTFAFVDPALTETDGADFTGVVVVSVDCEQNWYVRYAERKKLSPTELIDFMFKLYKQFKPNIFGIETVSYQKALLYFLHEEMKRRNQILPIADINPPNDKTKQMRIGSLIPRFEWGHVFFAQGQTDLELELLKFPRGAHDDIIDALAYIELIAHYPQREKKFDKKLGPNHPDYERQQIYKAHKTKRETQEDGTY